MKKRGIIFASGIGLAIIAFVTLAPIIPPPPGPAAAETDPVYLAAKDTDGTLAANSDAKVATQKAAKTYSDTKQTAAQVQALIDAGGFAAAGANADITSLAIAATIDGSTAANGDITIQGTSSGTRDTSYVLLQPNGGNVGIRTADPREALDVVGNIALPFSTDAKMGFQYLTGSDYFNGVSIDSSTHSLRIDSFSSDGNSNIAFRTGTVASPSTKVTVTYNGNSGFGTTNPQTKVHVTGAEPVIALGHSNWPSTYYAAITGEVTDGGGDTAGCLLFQTRQAATYTLTERSRINQLGNTLIATATDNGSKLNVAGSVTVGVGGTPVALIKTATATLDFPSTAAGTSSDLTITLTGAAVGDTIALGVPNSSVVANGSYSAWVSAADTLTVRYLNSDLVTAGDPASATFRGSLVQF